MNTEITVIQDTVSPLLRDLAEALHDPQRINRVRGQAVVNQLKDHFRARDAMPNKRGWPKQHLYSEFARATHLGEITTDAADVVVAHPAILQRIHGGEIKPKRGRMLALPAMALAAGAGSPREGATPVLKMLMAYNEAIGHWMWCLFAVEQATKEVKDRRKGHKGEIKTVPDPKQPSGIWYWLARSTNPPADPNAIPSDETLSQAATAAALEFFNSGVYRQKARAAT